MCMANRTIILQRTPVIFPLEHEWHRDDRILCVDSIYLLSFDHPSHDARVRIVQI